MARPVGGGTPLYRRPTTWLAAAATAIALVAALVIPARQRARVDEARASLERIETLADSGRYEEAYALAVGAEEVLGTDSVLQRLMPEVSDVLAVTSVPAGARVLIERVRPADESERAGSGPGPRQLGRTPISRTRLARGDYYVVVTADGYDPVERIATSGSTRWLPVPQDVAFDIALVPEGRLPEEMVPVPGGEYSLASADAPAGLVADLADYRIDRFEVTNAAYREFVRAGGYGDPEIWARVLPDSVPFSRVAGEMVDRTGLPGPRGWSGQVFPEGRGRHPVASVSWYEAAAYCEWAGKSLPTLLEWEKAARAGPTNRGLVMPWGVEDGGGSTQHRANFAGTGTVPVDSYPFGISPVGAYGMAGNVREWTTTAAADGYIAMGGSWQDPPYVFSSIATLSPDVTSPGLGFRCAVRDVEIERQGGTSIELDRPSPSYTPVDRATYESLLAHYRYDPVDLDARVVESGTTEDWARQRIEIRGVEGEPLIAYLYLPLGVGEPYQTLVFVPSILAFFSGTLDEHIESWLAPHIRSGRAVFAVVMDGMVERPRAAPPPSSNSVEFRNLMVTHSTQLSRGLDYLATRDDIDMTRLAYVGFSWGAGSRSTLAAIDDRWRAYIFIGAGIDERLHPTVPEALNVNFIPYIDGPKLMISGRQDEEHPWATRGRPFWELLSEPKDLVLASGEGHVPSAETRVPAINGFLDEIFGPPR